MSEFYCVCYSYTNNETVYRGGPLSYELAKVWVDHLTVKYPEMKHWVGCV